MKNNTKDSKQLLFEMMQKVNPDFKIIKEIGELNSLSTYNEELRRFFARTALIDTNVSLPAKILTIPFDVFQKKLSDENFIKALIQFVEFIDDDELSL